MSVYSRTVTHIRRTQAGLSQRELAQRSGLSVVTVANHEGDIVKDPHPSTVLKLARALGWDSRDQEIYLLSAAAGTRLPPWPGPGEPP